MKGQIFSMSLIMGDLITIFLVKRASMISSILSREYFKVRRLSVSHQQ